MQRCLAVEGELPEDWLVAYGNDLMLALARKIVSGDEDDAETVEAVFAAAGDAEASAEELLVDDGWKIVEVEPEAVAVDRDGSDVPERTPEGSWTTDVTTRLSKPSGRCSLGGIPRREGGRSRTEAETSLPSVAYSSCIVTPRRFSRLQPAYPHPIVGDASEVIQMAAVPRKSATATN